MKAIVIALALAVMSTAISGAFAPVLAGKMDGKPRRSDCKSAECQKLYYGKK